MNQGNSTVSEPDRNEPQKQDAAARWRKLLEDQRGSGLAISAFCRERGIPQSSLFAWRRRLKLGAGATFTPVKLVGESKPRPAADVAGSTGRPVRLSVDDVHSDAAAIELHLPGRRRLIVQRGFDRRLLLEVVLALESLT